MNEVRTTHTPGPWSVNDFEISGDISGAAICRVLEADDFPCIEEGTEDEVQAECEGNARLIAAAPDHALICWALCVAAGRWEPSSNGGEFCINGIRYSTKLDEFGCPVVNGPIRAAILKAQGTQS